MTASSASPERRFLRWIVPSLGSVVGLTALANALFFRGHQLFAWDGDVGRHIRVGRTILATGSIPRTDLFSHTRVGDPFVPYEWLSETFTALADHWLGLTGVAILSALLFVVAVLGVYRTSDELGAPRLLVMPVAVVALLLQSVHLLPRPHLFTTAIASLFMVILVRHARSGRAWDLAPLPILMLLWANAHGGYLIGFVLICAFLLGSLVRSPEFSRPLESTRALVATLVLCGLASLLNPAGIGLWSHTTGYLGVDYLVDATQEYQSVNFHEGYGKLFFVALFTGPVLWMTGRVRVTALAGGLYLVFAAASLYSARNIPLFTVASLPWLGVWTGEVMTTSDAGARLLERLRSLGALDRTMRPGLSCLIGAALVCLAARVGPSFYRFDSEAFPVDAVRAMGSELPRGNVFNQMSWGGYLLYERDDVPVFIDGQTDFYGEELSREYITVLKGLPGWNDVLTARGVEWTITRSAEPINQLLALDPDWTKLFSDQQTTLFLRLP